MASVIGAIRDKWLALGGPQSFLGEPLTDELTTPDGIGRFNQFQGGMIYWTPTTGPNEVHGAILAKYGALGFERSVLGYPTSDELPAPDGVGRFSRFQGGIMYWTPATGANEVHGAILGRFGELGFERSFLGYPTSDELDFAEGGRVSAFERGAIYWWPDTGPRALNNVVVHYTGVHCFGETDVDLGSSDDEPYATIGVVGPDGTKGTFRSQIYEDVDAGEGRFQVIEIYQGKPRGLVISTILQEHSGGNTEVSRAAMKEAVDKGGTALAGAATAIPVLGPVLGPMASVAHQVFKKDLTNALNSFVEKTLGFADRPLGEDTIELTPKQMVVLATRPEGHAQFGVIPFRFETRLLARFGASYKVYFNIFGV